MVRPEEVQKEAVKIKCDTIRQIEKMKLEREKVMHENIMEELKLAGKNGIKIFVRGRDHSSTKL